MIGLQAKTGIEATLERVFHAQGHHFSKLQVIWTGTTAGVSWRTNGSGGVKARFIMPALSDTATISKPDFANLLGYVMHELGHCWYTSNEAWEAGIEGASDKKLMHALINGLEDPRIESLVIRDQRATNSAPLFHALVESVLGNGYVEPDDSKNIPFMLAIEGRRLNGYPITVPSVFPKSPWSKILEQASRDALQAPDTQTVVEIAQRLYAQLTEKSQQEEQDGQGRVMSRVMSRMGRAKIIKMAIKTTIKTAIKTLIRIASRRMATNLSRQGTGQVLLSTKKSSQPTSSTKCLSV